VLSIFKQKKQKRFLKVEAARGFAFELSSESSFYSIETLIESRKKTYPLIIYIYIYMYVI